VPPTLDARRQAGATDLQRLVAALRSRRTIAVVLLSFSSGLPLGLVWYAIPDWMRDIGVDIRLVGLLTLAQAPWAFKVVWAPLMDHFVPPFWGRRRGWIAIAQLALLVCTLMLAGVGDHPDALWVVGAVALAIATASASQDIAYDAYTVDVLETDEQGAAAGARTAMYRAAMAVSGGLSITLASQWGWAAVNAGLAAIYLPMLALTWMAPPSPQTAAPPPTLRAALWQPFVAFLSKPRALEILAFVVFYKLADQLAQSLTRPFLIDMGYGAYDRGLALATVGLAATMSGALLGGWVTTLVGLGRGLWIFGLLQLLSNAGFYLVARAGEPNLPLMYAATSFELLTSGLGTGAFAVLLLRLTAKRFSATQYALFSSLFALPRLAAGPITGFTVHAIGWPAFYLATIVAGVPGLWLLARLVPWGVREPVFDADEEATLPQPTPSTAFLIRRGLLGGVLSAVAGLAVLVLLAALDAAAASPGGSLDLSSALAATLRVDDASGWIQMAGLLTFAAMAGVLAAAIASVRGGPRVNREGAGHPRPDA
jgi:PAT family beta-lactamase induction signal transducer AmpG